MTTVFFKLIRDKYTTEYTTGKMFLNLEFFGYTLERPVRPPHIKIKGETAIAADFYELVIRRDSKNIERVYINNVPLFRGIQCHGGNKVEDSLGCPLVARNKIDSETIQGSLEKEMIKLVKAAEHAYIEIINLNQLEP